MGNNSRSTMNKIVDEIHFRIKSNQDILKLLFHDGKDIDIYEQPNLSRNQANEVRKDKMFLRKRVASEGEMSCYICMWYGRKIYHHQKNQHYNNNTFSIAIICHGDIIINDYVGDRVSEIESIIEELFDGKDIGATCRCTVVNSEDIEVRGASYIGRQITIGFSDFKE